MTDKEKWELAERASKIWNEMPAEKRRSLVKHSASTQLVTLLQVKSKFANDMSPNLKRKITEWENCIAECLKEELEK